MNSEKPNVDRKKLIIIATSKSWLLPILYNIYSLQTTSLSELRELLDLKTSVVKRGLWWLTKYKLVEKIDNKYIVSKNLVKTLDELFINTCRVGNYYVFKMGKTYFLTKVARTRITSYSIPEKTLIEVKEKIISVEKNKLDLDELCNELKQPKILILRTLKLLNILGKCR